MSTAELDVKKPIKTAKKPAKYRLFCFIAQQEILQKTFMRRRYACNSDIFISCSRPTRS